MFYESPKIPTSYSLSNPRLDTIVIVDDSQPTMAPSSPNYEARIIDIRRGKVENTILDDMREQLRPQDGKEKRMPTLLLYDEVGLQLFEDITYLEEYYLTNAEINALESYGNQIAQQIQSGSLVVELGSGYDHAFPAADQHPILES